MPVITLTAFFRDDDGHGFSETHQVDGGVTVTSLATFLTAYDNFNKTFRVPLLAGDGFYIGCRASYPTANRQRAGSNLLADIAIAGPTNFGGEPSGMNLCSDALKVRMQNAASTANSDIYLRGVPDGIIQNGNITFGVAGGTAYKRALQKYTDALKGSAYGWVGINPATTSRGNVSNAVSNPDGTVTFTIVATNGVPLVASPNPVTFKFAKINRSQSILNRAIICTITSPVSVTSVNQIAFGSFDTAGIYSALVKGFIPYDHYAYTRAGSRKTGKPFGVGRGRLAAQVLH